MTKVLIIGTAPYDKNCQSRAFESYFNGINPDDLAQIFTYQYVPPKGHCGKLYQITDGMMLKRFFNSKYKVGKKYYRDELNEDGGIISKKISERKSPNKLTEFLYRYGRKDRPSTYLLRGILWRKKKWCTDDLIQWLEEFKPDVIFLSFSDDFFIPKIAKFVAEYFDIPIVSSIADDYFFNDRISFSPLYYIYRFLYKSLITSLLTRKGSTAVYIGDKIRDKYNTYFGMEGETLYLTTNINRRTFLPINRKKVRIGYFGNVRLGRNLSLVEIGNALQNIDSKFEIDVYTNEKEKRFTKILLNKPGINLKGSIPYNEVQEKIKEYDILAVVESFRPKDIKIVKYSISTKVPDSIASGVPVLAYGDKACGAIDYLDSTNCTATCSNKDELVSTIDKLINSESLQKRLYEKSQVVIEKNHDLNKNVKTFSILLKKSLEEYKNDQK